MREETHLEPICTYCKCSITNKLWPYKTLNFGEKAHLALKHPSYGQFGRQLLRTAISQVSQRKTVLAHGRWVKWRFSAT